MAVPRSIIGKVRRSGPPWALSTPSMASCSSTVWVGSAALFQCGCRRLWRRDGGTAAAGADVSIGVVAAFCRRGVGTAVRASSRISTRAVNAASWPWISWRVSALSAAIGTGGWRCSRMSTRVVTAATCTCSSRRVSAGVGTRGAPGVGAGWARYADKASRISTANGVLVLSICSCTSACSVSGNLTVYLGDGIATSRKRDEAHSVLRPALDGNLMHLHQRPSCRPTSEHHVSAHCAIRTVFPYTFGPLFTLVGWSYLLRPPNTWLVDRKKRHDLSRWHRQLPVRRPPATARNAQARGQGI